MIKKDMASQINWPIKETPTITERQKNCPYCHEFDKGYKPVYTSWPRFGLYVFPNGSFEMDYDDNCMPASFMSESGVINYCPMCGRPLNEKA